jgi:hypothetical protein
MTLVDTGTKARFRDWLKAHGAEVLEPTNRYEVVRFATARETCVIYRGKRGFSYTGEAQAAWDAFAGNRTWDAGSRQVKSAGARAPKVRALLERDGEMCFYCHIPLLEDCTLEHLLSKIHGGTNHIANLALAHQVCNRDASHLSVVEKVKLRESKRTK